MSNFLAITIHPVAGIAMQAMWHANYFGTRYGVEFHGDDEIYPAHECEQVKLDQQSTEQCCKTCKFWQLSHGYMDCGAPDTVSWNSAGNCTGWQQKPLQTAKV